MPNRIIREGILSSERIASLGWAEEVFYRRLMSIVDDYGRTDANLQLLRSRCYPLQTDDVRTADISRWMAACQKAGLILGYEVADKCFVEVNNFGQQQRTASKFPNPPSRTGDGNQPISTDIKCSQTLANAHLVGVVVGDVVEGVLAPTVLVPEAENPASVDPPSLPQTIPACPATEVVALYHEVLPELPRVERVTEARRAHIRQRWREWAAEKHWSTAAQGLDDWRKFFVFVRRSSFLMGQVKPREAGRSPFVADLDFLMAPGSHVKIFEGKYHENA
ncbi:MAG: hypothetical protein ABIX37_10780 [Gammaproteobacteria bacterium]